MVERRTGKNAISALQLSRETGVRQQNLSRWLNEARKLPHVGSDQLPVRQWTVEQKARLLADVAKLEGDELMAQLERIG